MKELIYGAAGPLSGFNPIRSGVEWNEASSLLLNRLFRQEIDGMLQPDLVKDYTVSPDGLAWTLRLRDGVIWHDGKPCDGRDVCFTLGAVLRSEPPSKFASDLSMIQDFESVSGSDHKIVRLKLNRPAPGLAAPLREVPILPGHLLTGKGMEDPGFEERPIGTGPYRLERRGEGELHFVRHDAFFRGRPSIERIVLRSLPSEQARADALLSGKVHLTHVKALTRRSLGDDPGVRWYTMESNAILAVPFNVRIPELADVRVRRALAAAVDRQALIQKGVAGEARPICVPLSPWAWGYPSDRPIPGQDLELARRLLRQAGWEKDGKGMLRKEGKPLQLLWNVWKDEPFRSRGAECLKLWWGALGVDLRLDLVDFLSYDRRAGNLGVTHAGFIGGWGGALDPADVLYRKFHSRGSQNYGGYRNPELDRLLELAHPLGETEAARPLFSAIFDLLDREVPWVPLAGATRGYFGADARVGGMRSGMPSSWYEFPMHAHDWSWAAGAGASTGHTGAK
jgi:peptide/nickel transport system substrate-binding protein